MLASFEQKPKLQKVKVLRVVRTQAVLFVKSASELRGVSDIERLGIWMTPSFNFKVLVSRIRLLPTLISKMKRAMVWTTLKFDRSSLVIELETHDII